MYVCCRECIRKVPMLLKLSSFFCYLCLQHGIVVVGKKQQPNEMNQMYASDVMSKLEKIHIVSLML